MSERKRNGKEMSERKRNGKEMKKDGREKMKKDSLANSLNVGSKSTKYFTSRESYCT